VKTKHTPGPWRSGDRFNTVFGPNLGKPSPETIATVFRGNEANARLISAAPDLLAQLKALVIQIEASRVLVVPPNVKAAIAKAQGEVQS
jgi:hypothetical protein